MDDWDAFQQALPGASVRGGETFLPIESALAGLDWVDGHDALLLGMEGFHLTRDWIQPSERHIADFSPTPATATVSPQATVDFARDLLRSWRNEIDAVVLVIATE